MTIRTIKNLAMKKTLSLCAWIATLVILGSFWAFTTGHLSAKCQVISTYLMLPIGFAICSWGLLTLPDIDHPPVSVIILVYLTTFLIPWNLPLAIVVHDALYHEVDTINFAYMPFGQGGIISIFVTMFTVWVGWGIVESLRPKKTA